jgi:mono/diheme cytochrome c family protein
MQGWYAPSLASAAEAGVAEWSTQDVVDLLGTGVSARGSVIGPMAEVVFRSTQHLDAADLQAVATYLRALPQQPVAAPAADEVERADSAVLARGERIYGQSCAQCHGEQGEGQPGAYPRLAGNRAVTMAEPTNLVQVIMHGGYLPATAGNPRPYGMPPFAQSLDDAEIAAVTTYLRQSWGNMAPGVLPLEVQRLR